MASLFEPSTYRRIALAGNRITGLSPGMGIDKYQAIPEDTSKQLNDILLRIYNDEELYAAVRAYGKRIPFANNSHNSSGFGFVELALDPEKRMTLKRIDKIDVGELHYESELREYTLFQIGYRIFYAKTKQIGDGIRSELRNEAVLASKDMAGYEQPEDFDKTKIPTAEQVKKSLEEAIERIGK